MQQEHSHVVLWSAVQRGNETAFRRLFDLYWEALFLYACRILKDRSLAQDTVQGLFIHLWEKHNSLPDVAAVAPYLRSALRNRLLNAIRDHQVYQRHVDLFRQVLQEGDNSTANMLQLKDTEQQLLQSINSLPGKMKDVFYLHRIQHLSVAEIALKLGTSPQTIRNQLNSALHRLKAQWPAGLLCLLFCLPG